MGAFVSVLRPEIYPQDDEARLRRATVLLILGCQASGAESMGAALLKR